MSRYDFGYSWYIPYGLAVPFALAVVVVLLSVWRGWPRWVALVSGAVALWAAVGLILASVVLGFNRPMSLPTARFLATGSGRVLDAGAGSGRAAVGILIARPGVTVTGLDIYSGYWGIDDNTPERFLANARAAGAADRAEARTGDMRAMPFPDGEFDAVVSAYAMDHLRREGREKAIAESARVLKPGGQLLVLIVKADWLTLLSSPLLAHHQRPDPARWRSELERGGFVVDEQGTQPATLFFLARRRT